MAESRPNPSGTKCLPSESECSQMTRTQTQTVEKEEEKESPPVLILRLHQPDRQDHRVKWSSDTIDNEFMGKKKSKCCCIYEKPKVFGESDTSSEEEDQGDEGCTPHCRGHKKKCYRHHTKGHHHDHDDAHHHHHHSHDRDHDDDNMAGVT